MVSSKVCWLTAPVHHARGSHTLRSEGGAPAWESTGHAHSKEVREARAWKREAAEAQALKAEMAEAEATDRYNEELFATWLENLTAASRRPEAHAEKTPSCSIHWTLEHRHTHRVHAHGHSRHAHQHESEDEDEGPDVELEEEHFHEVHSHDHSHAHEEKEEEAQHHEGHGEHRHGQQKQRSGGPSDEGHEEGERLNHEGYLVETVRDRWAAIRKI